MASVLARVGRSENLYYTDEMNISVQSLPVEANYRFIQGFSNLNSGVSTLVYPPAHGVRHILVVLNFAQADISGNTGLYALPRGFGYQAIKNITFRVGGSSMYTLTGSQLLQRNLRLVKTESQKQRLYQLGGQAATTAADFAQDLTAYIPISVFTCPASDSIALPLPTDLLSSQLQIQVELNPPSSYWVQNPNPGSLAGFVPAGFSSAYFQVEALMANDRGMLLANNVDMNTHSYTYPLPDFDQTEIQIPLVATTSVQPITSTGYRAGEVRALQVYITRDNDALNKGRFYAPKSAEVLYAGQVYSSFSNGSSLMWNLLDGTAAPIVDTVAFSAPSAPGPMVATPALNAYAILPFAQSTGDDFEGRVLVRGKRIQNGSIQINVQLPWVPTSSADTGTLHIVPVYNASCVFSRGSADIVWE